MGRGRGTLVVATACVAILAAAGPAFAQTPQPTPSPRGATVEGSVTGGLQAGADLTLVVEATMPGGWELLHLVDVTITSGGAVLETLSYDIEDVQLTVGDQRVVGSTGGVAAGEYLRVSGADIILTTGGGNLIFEVTGEVLRQIPEDAVFELGVTDDRGTETSVTRKLEEPPNEGLTWQTVVTAVLVALLLGGVVGNLFASKRRPPPRLSVYGAIDRRIRAERESS